MGDSRILRAVRGQTTRSDYSTPRGPPGHAAAISWRLLLAGERRQAGAVRGDLRLPLGLGPGPAGRRRPAVAARGVGLELRAAPAAGAFGVVGLGHERVVLDVDHEPV